MKIFLDFLPLLLFFLVGKYADSHTDWAARFATDHFGFLVSGGVVGTEEASALLATLVVIVATALQIAWLLASRRKVDLMLWATFVLVVVLGGATIWFHNATFIKWKPSVLYWAMGVTLWLGQTVFGKNLLQALIGEQLQLPRPVWQRLNSVWIVFFLLLGALNLYVAYHFPTSTWFTFKAFGVTGLMIVFMLGQGLYLSRHLQPEPASVAEERPPHMTVTAADLDARLRESLAPSALDIRDDSHLHAGHAGAREGRHFAVRIVSERFVGLSRVARHRLVYDAAQLLIAGGIHALAIDAKAPGET